MRKFLLTSVMALAVCLGFQGATAQAQWGGGYSYPGYGGYGYGNGGYGYGGYGGGGFGGQGQFGSYYGNGGHDFQPHWHVTQTPFGANAWYGNGPHDAMPHQHTRTPWSYQGYSNTGAGPTTSFYSPQPYYYAPW